jgi:serine protease Do
MNSKIMLPAILAFGITTGAVAQSKEKTPDPEKKKKEESITIRKKSGSDEKTTIVIDGDNITVNGKPLKDLKDSDVQVFRNNDLAPMLKFKQFMPEGGMKMFGEGFPFGGNKAVLGVGSAKDEKGAKVKTVEKESAAEKAGLKQDDIITKVGDNKIEGSDDLYDAIGKYEPGDKVNITYLRDGKEAQTSVTLGENKSKPRVFTFNGDDFKKNFNENFHFKLPAPGHSDWNDDFSFSRKPRLGMSIQDQADGKGVKVIDVDEDAAADKAGLKKDDVITAIDGKNVNSVDELKSSIRQLKEGDNLEVTYQRAGKTQTATISFPKKLKTAEL